MARPLIVTAIAALLLTACGPSSGASSLAPTASPSVRPEVSASPGSVASAGDANVRVASADGLTVTVEPDRQEVEPGGTVVAQIRVRNDRPEPVVDSFGCLLAPRWTVDVLMPFEPAGRSWTGIAGKFKDYAMNHSDQPGIISSRRPVQTMPFGDPCVTAPASLAAGATAEWTLKWQAPMTPGIEAPVGTDPFTIVAAYPPHPEPGSTPTPAPTSPRGPFFAKSLSVSGTIKVAGQGPHLVSAGEAIDALLAYRRFATWLPKQPATTWST